MDDSSLDVENSNSESDFAATRTTTRSNKRRKKRKTRLTLNPRKRKVTDNNKPSDADILKWKIKKSKPTTIDKLPEPPTDTASDHESHCDPDETLIHNTTQPASPCDPSDHSEKESVVLQEQSVITPFDDDYRNYCFKALSDPQMLCSLINNLYADDALNDYLSLVTCLSDGRLPVKNIAVIAALEAGKLQMCTNVVQMRYRKEWTQFCESMYRTGGGKIIRLMAGPKLFGVVTGQKCEKSIYPPDMGKWNFPIPDEKTLAKSVTDVPGDIPPGFIEHAIQNLPPNKEWVLTYDGMKVSPGFTDTHGDISMIGFEEPNLDYSRNVLDENLSWLNKYKMQISCYAEIPKELQRQLMNGVRLTSVRVRNLRIKQAAVYKQRKGFEKLIAKDPSLQKKYTNAFHNMDSYKIETDSLITKLLEANTLWTKICSALNGNLHHWKENTVDLSHQTNTLLLRDTNDINDDDFLRDNPQYVKQRSNMWIELRKASHLTASTMHKALGFDKLSDQRKHHKVFIGNQTPPQATPSVQAMFNYGTVNELQAIGTLVTRIMPAILPNCFRFFEWGCSYINGNKVAKLMVCSPDGILKCIDPNHMNKRCPTACGLLPEPMIVEIKCPYNAVFDKTQTPVRYQIPVYNACQLLANMKAHNVNTALYVTYSKKTTAVCVLKFDESVWKDVNEICLDLYDTDNPPFPDETHSRAFLGKEILQKYLDENSFFLMEVPSVQTSCTYKAQPHPIFNCYQNKTLSINVPMQILSNQEVHSTCLSLCTSTAKLIKSSYEKERNKATEVMVFVLSDTDREYNPNVPIAIPVAYILKGSLKPSTLRQIVDYIQVKLQNAGIRVVAESFDGQWTNMVVRSADHKPLTLLELNRDVWKATKDLSLKYIMKNLRAIAEIHQRDLYECEKFDKLEMGTVTFGNVNVSCEYWTDREGTQHRFLAATSNGGILFNPGQSCTFKFPTSKERNDLWRKSQYIPADMNILRYISDDDVNNLYASQLQASASQGPLRLYDFIKHEMCTNYSYIIDNILAALKVSKYGPKWVDINSAEHFYEKCFLSAKSINRSFRTDEIDIISEILRKELPAIPNFVHKSLKFEKVNRLAHLFGITDFLHKKEGKVKQMRSLSMMAWANVKKIYPYEVMKNTLRVQIWEAAHKRWIANSPVMCSVSIPVMPFIFNSFACPELLESIGLPMCRFIDPTHILTNLRLHATKTGIFGCDPKAFLRVAKYDNTILNEAIVTLYIDKQNAAIAQRVFSEEVENVMILNGDFKEAEMVSVIRNWFQACDSRGLSVIERLQRFIRMHNYLMSFIKIPSYPPPGGHIAGLPDKSFQAIMTNVSLRILLYGICLHHTYNQRTLGTLTQEGMYSTMSELCRQTNGVPIVNELGQILATMLRVQQIKFDPNKIFHYWTTKKNNYPSHPADITPKLHDQREQDDLNYMTHLFDVERSSNVKPRVRRSNVHSDERPLHGVREIRFYHKCDESNISTLTRKGLT